jgi:hypothetical protein
MQCKRVSYINRKTSKFTAIATAWELGVGGKQKFNRFFVLEKLLSSMFSKFVYCNWCMNWDKSEENAG